MPLQFFKVFLRAGYIIGIIFVLVTIPLFSFFSSDPLNGAELYVRYFSLGSMFLLLLFPYQRTKVNVVVFVCFLISLLFMLILARRNVVLYLGSAVFFLSLVIIFFKSKIFGKRKPIVITGAVLTGLATLVLIALLQFNFDLFFERANTGMDSREGVIDEFTADFNTNEIDWIIGRGPFGTFFSRLGNENTNERQLIENGYLQQILQKGFLFLVPFVLLSIVAIFNGFFRSRNHLSKAAAILVIVNLIDMIGYGLPFLGLKYLNLLIAFGFCFSTAIRNMDDSEIKKLIRL
jgi:hypothetical protein